MTNRVWARQRLKLQRLGLADHMTARPGRRPWSVLKAKVGRKLVRYWVDELDRRLLAHMSLDHGSKVDNPLIALSKPPQEAR